MALTRERSVGTIITRHVVHDGYFDRFVFANAPGV